MQLLLCRLMAMMMLMMTITMSIRAVVYYSSYVCGSSLLLNGFHDTSAADLIPVVQERLDGSLVDASKAPCQS